jgi:membrane protease YdiL (CAAX protease family)
VAALYRQMTWEAAVPFLLFIAVVPAFMEELLFRGYIQGRLLQRWPAWVAILVTSVLFALMHVAPHAVAAAFPLGLWLGVLAWRTGSVWPGIVCHAFVNGAWNVWQVGRSLTGLEENPPAPVLVGLGVVGLVCFVLSCRLLLRPERAPLPAPKEEGFPPSP